MRFLGKARNTLAAPTDDDILLGMVDRTQAVIHFQPDGKILTANENFLSVLGYTLPEIRGENHSMFVPPGDREGDEYRSFWARLRSGEIFTGQFPRMRKDGSTVYIQGTYCPISDSDGTVTRVIKVAVDVTTRRETINDLYAGLKALEGGNLSYRVADAETPDLQALVDAFNATLRHLSQLVADVKHVSRNVSATSQELQSTTNDLSHRTETQAATLEQTAAAVEQLTVTARSAAENADTVRNVAIDTRSSAESGRTLVNSLTEAMKKIEDSSDQISSIISVIESISFQTNLLALNAGVEAARAGESGRGFAVVASEVRGLAQRSSESAMEIKALIEQSSHNVSNGSDLVGRTSKEFATIYEGVDSISKRVQEIAHGMNEQSQTLTEINSSVSQLDQVTQHNAAMVEETTDVGHRLAQDAGNLVSSVDFFSSEEDMAPPSEPAYRRSA